MTSRVTRVHLSINTRLLSMSVTESFKHKNTNRDFQLLLLLRLLLGSSEMSGNRASRLTHARRHWAKKQNKKRKRERERENNLPEIAASFFARMFGHLQGSTSVHFYFLAVATDDDPKKAETNIATVYTSRSVAGVVNHVHQIPFFIFYFKTKEKRKIDFHNRRRGYWTSFSLVFHARSSPDRTGLFFFSFLFFFLVRLVLFLWLCDLYYTPSFHHLKRNSFWFHVSDERDAIQKKTFTKWVNKHLRKVGKNWFLAISFSPYRVCGWVCV